VLSYFCHIGSCRIGTLDARPEASQTRVCDDAGNVIETQEHKGNFKEAVKKFGRLSLENN
jgi:hypothetical protein